MRESRERTPVNAVREPREGTPWGNASASTKTSALALAAQTPKIETLGPQVGTRVQDFAGVDQFGTTHTLQSLLGREGLMLVFYRSADW